MKPTTSKPIVALLITLVATACAQVPKMPDYPEGSIRAHVWKNLGPPMSVGTRDDGIEGWFYKVPQLIGNHCRYFTAWFDGEFVFLQEPMQATDDMTYCRTKEDVDLSAYDPSKPRSELIVRDRI